MVFYYGRQGGRGVPCLRRLCGEGMVLWPTEGHQVYDFPAAVFWVGMPLLRLVLYRIASLEDGLVWC